MQALWLYTLLGGLASGIFVRSLFVYEWPEVYLVLLIALSLAIVRRVYNESEYRTVFGLLGIAILGFGLGSARMVWEEERWPLASALPPAEIIEGVVVKAPDVRESSQHLYVKTEKELLLVYADPYQAVAYGDRLVMSGSRSIPEVFETDLGRSFDYPGYLKARGVQHVVRHPKELEVASHDNANLVVSTLLKIKSWFSNSLQSVLPNPSLGLGLGVLLGEQQALGSALLEDFRKAGVIHIVVLSGYNIMLVIGFVLFVLRQFIRRRYRMWVALAAIAAFALMVGLSATVLRASVMGAMYVVAYSLGRQYAVLRSLLLAGAIMLLINPYLLVFDIGFQLSFMATLGLIAALPWLENLEGPWWKKGGIALFITTLATQIAVLPLLMYQIGQVSVVSVLTNMLVVPMVPFAMTLTFLTGILASVHTILGSIAAYGAFLSLQYIIVVAQAAASLPFSTATLPPLPGASVFLGYFIIGLFWYRWQRRVNFISSNTTSEADDWQIEEELEKGEAKLAPTSPSSETPIFFR